MKYLNAKQVLAVLEVARGNSTRDWCLFLLKFRHALRSSEVRKLKLADIVINVTAGGPGGATDTVSSFIYRVYRDRSNVGYGTGLAMFYLLMIIALLTVLLRLSNRWTRNVA